MEQHYSPEDHLSKLTQSWIGTVLIMGAVLFPVLEFMDYFVSIENFKRFMVYRLVISALLMILYGLNRLKRSKAYQYGIAVAGTAMCAVVVEVAVLQSGGQSSPYYAAMIILAICCLSFVPLNLTLSFILVGIIYGIYLAPILLTETVTSGVFVSNNAFLISAFVIGLLLRYHNQKLIVSELQLRLELFEDKRRLELHSDSLRGQVDEKISELAVSEQKYRGLFDNAMDGIAVLDSDGKITDANRQFFALHGSERESIIGLNYRRLEAGPSEKEQDDRLARVLKGESLLYETDHCRKDGSTMRLEISARAIDIGGVAHILAFYRDITEKKQLQEQAIQSQKLESMGVLAGGIAHDFNNSLTAILGHTEVLRRRIGADEFGLRRIKTIEDAAKRAGFMVSKLLSFARGEPLELVPTDLNMVVMDTADLLGRTFIDRNIAVKVETDPDIPAVSGDGIRLEHVITNLAMNAMDAMPGGGTLTIRTLRMEVNDQSSQLRPFLKPGKYVVLAMGDTGTGMSREVRSRLFEPFFTTKPAGKGTGLGLAMVYGIVKSHQGEVWVRSETGVGTTFEIYLPSLDMPIEFPDRANDAVPLHYAGGSECILVVDDEQDILSYIKDTLESYGYKTFAADNSAYAQELFQGMAKEIDLVITDMVMPLMNGAELSRKLRTIKPEIRVIGITGFSGGAAAQAVKDIDLLIKKPFDGVRLVTAVRSLLDGRGALRR